MKQIIIVFALFLSASTFCQDVSSKKIYKNGDLAIIHSIKYTVNSTKDLKMINWDDIKEIFKDNKPEELIELAFEIDLSESKNKFKSSAKVGGKTKDLDSLIIKLKKVQTGIIKISKNHEKQ